MTVLTARRCYYHSIVVRHIVVFFRTLRYSSFCFFFFFNDTATTEIYTFPYTTLFRSVSRPEMVTVLPVTEKLPAEDRSIRSEEHTSELQSQSNLVCRLLLEKKKNQQPTTSQTSHTTNTRHHTTSLLTYTIHTTSSPVS